MTAAGRLGNSSNNGHFDTLHLHFDSHAGNTCCAVQAANKETHAVGSKLPCDLSCRKLARNNQQWHLL